jgi:hypothetical protein
MWRYNTCSSEQRTNSAHMCDTIRFFCFKKVRAGTAPSGVVARTFFKKGPFRLLYNRSCPAVSSKARLDSNDDRRQPRCLQQRHRGRAGQALIVPPRPSWGSAYHCDVALSEMACQRESIQRRRCSAKRTQMTFRKSNRTTGSYSRKIRGLEDKQDLS